MIREAYTQPSSRSKILCSIILVVYQATQFTEAENNALPSINLYVTAVYDGDQPEDHPQTFYIYLTRIEDLSHLTLQTTGSLAGDQASVPVHFWNFQAYEIHLTGNTDRQKTVFKKFIDLLLEVPFTFDNVKNFIKKNFTSRRILSKIARIYSIDFPEKISNDAMKELKRFPSASVVGEEVNVYFNFQTDDTRRHLDASTYCVPFKEYANPKWSSQLILGVPTSSFQDFIKQESGESNVSIKVASNEENPEEKESSHTKEVGNPLEGNQDDKKSNHTEEVGNPLERNLDKEESSHTEEVGNLLEGNLDKEKSSDTEEVGNLLEGNLDDKKSSHTEEVGNPLEGNLVKEESSHTEKVENPLEGQGEHLGEEQRKPFGLADFTAWSLLTSLIFVGFSVFVKYYLS